MKRIREFVFVVLFLVTVLACQAMALGINIDVGDQFDPKIDLSVNAPSDLRVTTFPGVLQVDLEWKDNSKNETGFTIERSVNHGSFAVIATVKDGVTDYTDYDVTNDMLCCYRVCANGLIGKSDYSNEVELVTVPNAPSDLMGNLNNGQITLYWKGNNKNSGYKIIKTTLTGEKRSITSLYGGERANTKENTFTDRDIKPGSVYSYYVFAFNDSGNSDISNTVTFHYPKAPSDVRISYFPGSDEVSFIWKDNSDDEIKFIVEEAHSNKGGIESNEVPANTTEFVDKVETDALFMYRVAAVGPNGEFSPYSEVVNWYAPPRMPDGLVLEAISATEVKLTWNDRSNIETGYKITRNGDKAVVPIAVGANVTTYNDVGLKPNTQYSYRIKAENNISNTSSEFCPPIDIVTPSGTGIIVSPENMVEIGGVLPPGFKMDVVLEINSPNMKVNGVSQAVDSGKATAPVIIGGRTLLPIRAIIEAYRGTLEWDAAAQKVTIKCNGKTIELWINSTATFVDGNKVIAEVAPRIINGRTMLPLRFVSENLGLEVNWDSAKKQITIKPGS